MCLQRYHAQPPSSYLHLLDALNSKHPSLNFTMETAKDNTLPFLGMNVAKNKQQVKHQGLYLFMNSISFFDEVMESFPSTCSTQCCYEVSRYQNNSHKSDKLISNLYALGTIHENMQENINSCHSPQLLTFLSLIHMPSDFKSGLRPSTCNLLFGLDF